MAIYHIVQLARMVPLKQQPGARLKAETVTIALREIAAVVYPE